MRYKAYGLSVDCEVPMPGLHGVPAEGVADLTVSFGPAFPVPAGRRGERIVDGRPFVVRAGASGELDMRWGDEGAFHLAGGRLTAWSPVEPGPRWWRVLLDSALGSVVLGMGAEALHAGAVVVDGGALAVAAGTGGGKTSVLAELVAAGHALLADDVLVIDEGLRVHPAPPLMNLALDRPPDSVAPETLGTVLAELDDEAWTAVTTYAAACCPLRALVVVDRTGGDEPSLEPMPPLGVLPFMLASGAAPGRVSARFRLATAIAARLPVARLRAPAWSTPAQLAALARSVLDG